MKEQLSNNKAANLQKARIDTGNLYEIIEDIPELNSEDILFCAPIYYPIGEISINYRERNFEDFEAVEQLILKLFKLKVTDPAVLSETLGIPESYVRQTLKVLVGYGFIDYESGKLTQSGELSLQKGRKIYTSDVEQIFQLDLLNKQLLKINDRIRNSNLRLLNKTYKESSTYNEIGHLDFSDNIDTKIIADQLKNNFDNLVERSSETLRQIPEKLNKITPVPGFKYAEGYIVLIKEFENPIIVVKRYNPGALNRKLRNVWKPLGLNSQKELEKLKLSDLNLNTIETTNYIIDLFNELAKQDFSDEEELDELNQFVPFNREGIESTTRDEFIDEFKINRLFFKEYDPYIFEILERMVKDGKFLVIRAKLYGQVISLTSKDPAISQVYSLFNQAVEKAGSKKAVIGAISGKINDNNSAIDELYQILKSLVLIK